MNIKRLLLGLASLVAGWGLSPIVAAEEVGSVMLAAGKTFVDAGGASRAASNNMKINEGDGLRTGPDGYLYLQTRDGGFFILRPNSSAKVAVFRYDPKQPQASQVKVELTGGVARMVTGDASKQARDQFRMNTPVAAIGVRGTDFTVFADATVTRASVRSGGIVVGSFANGCSPSGNGPCTGDSSRVLMAGGEPLIVEVQRGDKLPRLIKSEQLAPDRIAPPGPGEPVAEKHPAAAAAAPPPPEASYIASNTLVNQPLPAVVQPAVEAPKPPVAAETPPVAVVTPPVAPATPPVAVVTPPVVETPPPVAVVTPPAPVVVVEPPAPVVVTPPPRMITWGRWQTYANLPANTDLKTALKEGRQVIMIGQAQVMLRDTSEKVSLPNEGKASFSLAEHEGYFINETTGQTVAAQASNATLSFDFGKSTFATSMNLAGGSLSTVINATGYVGSDGKFQSDALAGSSVNGAIGGSDLREAGYIYHRRVNDQVTADGATYWKR